MAAWAPSLQWPPFSGPGFLRPRLAALDFLGGRCMVSLLGLSILLREGSPGAITLAYRACALA